MFLVFRCLALKLSTFKNSVTYSNRARLWKRFRLAYHSELHARSRIEAQVPLWRAKY